MLGTDTKTFSNLVHIGENVEAIDYSFSTCWSIKTYVYVYGIYTKVSNLHVYIYLFNDVHAYTCQYGHCCCLSCSIVSQENSNLTFIHVQCDIVYSLLPRFLLVFIREKSVK